MVSTRTTARSQRQVQRLDCSVPWLLVVHILPPLGGAGAILEAAGLEGAGRRRGLRKPEHTAFEVTTKIAIRL